MDTSFLVNLDNYYEMKELAQNGYQSVYTGDINDNNLDKYFNGVLNIFRDGIETEEVQNMFIEIKFTDNEVIELHICDLFFNLIFWKLWTSVNKPISSEALFFEENLTKKCIKSFCDHMFIKQYRTKLPFIQLNNILDDATRPIASVDDFALFLSDTVCMEDTLDLMNSNPEFMQALTPDFSNVPFEDIMKEGMKYANKQVEIIKNSDHCLNESFNSGEGINPKQFKEVNSDIGTKPNGEGSIYPIHINTSFITGGLDKIEYYLVESATGRLAQIIQKKNVAESGEFARLLDINNLDTVLHPDPNYFCDTKHLLRVRIENSTMLEQYNMRYYKKSLMDEEFYILDDEEDTDLIGQTLYFYSPTKCASHARGEGICRRCYGELYFINVDKNAGKLSADLLSAKYTQKNLSAKHLLESKIIALVWLPKKDDGSPVLFDILDIQFNMLMLYQDKEYDGYSIKIDSEQINLEESDVDDDSYTESITSFFIIYPDGHEVEIKTENSGDMYLSKDINNFIREHTENQEDEDKYIYINLKKFNSIYKNTGTLFLVNLDNEELSTTLKLSKATINKNAVTSTFDIEGIVHEFITVNNAGGMVINSVHEEVIISNQIRDIDNILEAPDWTRWVEPKYKIITLSQSLSNNPSVTKCLEYKRVADALYKPLTFKKHKASFLDVYFMKRPQDYINNAEMVTDEVLYDQTDSSRINKITPFVIDENLIRKTTGIGSSSLTEYIDDEEEECSEENE